VSVDAHISRLRDALWFTAFVSVGFTEGRRWISGALFVAALVVAWRADTLEHPDD
jgi:hypothetical protein